MALTIAEVERIAALAHLELTPDEKELFARQLADILAYARELQSVDTSGVPATAYVTDALDAERDDAPRGSLAVADVLSNAPDGVLLTQPGLAGPDDEGRAGDGKDRAGLFRVPRVIG